MKGMFYLVTPPGFEADAEREMAELWPFLLNPAARTHDEPLPEFHRDKGGLEFEADVFAALQTQLFHSTASRLLWRLASFKATSFPELHGRLRKVDAKRWLGPQKKLRLKVAASKSRLGQEKRIAQVLQDAWGIESSDQARFGVFLRIENDLVTLSLDTTGEHLHKRGELIERGEAPIRETLAAHLLRLLTQDTPRGALRNFELVDPFGGSGTFAVESSRAGAGRFARDYDFLHFFGLPKLFRTERFSANYQLPPPGLFASYVVADCDVRVLASARKNWQQAWRDGKAPPIEWRAEDVLTIEPPSSSARERWMICNPPYGERLETESPAALVAAAVKRWRPRRCGVIWPRALAKNPEIGSGSRPVASHCLKNGGIECLFQVFEFSH